MYALTFLFKVVRIFHYVVNCTFIVFMLTVEKDVNSWIQDLELREQEEGK